MTPEELDVIVRVAGATLLLAAVGLAGPRPDRPYFIPLAFCLCGFLAGNTPDPALRLSGFAGQTAHLLSGFAAPFLWWFCLAVFDRSFRPRGPVLIAGAAWIAIASADRGLLGPGLEDIGLSWLLVGLGFGMLGHLTWRLIQGREGDLLDHRRDARILVVLFLAGQLLVDLAVDVVLGMEWRPRAFSIAQNVALLAFTGWLVSLSLRGADARRAPAGAASAARRAAPPTQHDSRLAERLRVLVEDERIALDPELTFARFVAAMGASERTVRRLINHQLGYDHFRTFLNAHRMEEARRRLSDPTRAQEKLIVVAMDSGFASLASFNRVFQEVEGCAPSTFRTAALRHTNAEADARGLPPGKRPATPSEERSAGF